MIGLGTVPTVTDISNAGSLFQNILGRPTANPTGWGQTYVDSGPQGVVNAIVSSQEFQNDAAAGNISSSTWQFLQGYGISKPGSTSTQASGGSLANFALPNLSFMGFSSMEVWLGLGALAVIAFMMSRR